MAYLTDYYPMSEPEPVTWASNFRHDDVSTWVALGDITQPACCENGWLPLSDGTMIRCWRCDEREAVTV